MNENKNLILAIVLSAFVLLGWSFLSETFIPAQQPPPKVENGKVVPTPQPQADPTADRPQALRARAQVLAETPRVKIQTPSLQGSINLRGARMNVRGLRRTHLRSGCCRQAARRAPISHRSAGRDRALRRLRRKRSGRRALQCSSRAGRSR